MENADDGTDKNRGSRHSMHLLSRWVHLWHTYVCPHGRTIGTRSVKLNSSKQMTQWNGTMDAAAAATLDKVPIVIQTKREAFDVR